MLGVFIYILVFAPVYLAYRWVKQKIYTYMDLGQLNESKERFLFLVCLYVFIFISTWRFTIVSPSGIGGFYSESKTYLFPFSEIIEANRFNVFYEYVSGNAITDLSQLIKEYLLTFAQSMVILMPLSLSIFAAYGNHLKRFVVLFVTVVVSYFFSGSLYLGSTIINVLILYVLTYIVYTLVQFILNLVFKEDSPNSIEKRGMAIWLVIFILLAGVVFTSDIRIMTDSYASTYKAPETIEFDESYNIPGEVELTLESAKLKSDHTEIELDYTVYKVPEMDIPYEYKILHMTLDLQTGENRYQYGFASNNEENDGYTRTSSLRINNIDINDSHINKSVFPLTIYGISELVYVITDSNLLDHIAFEDSGWNADEPYTCYWFTYRVPKVPGYDLKWNVPLKYNDLIEKKYNPNYSYYTKSKILEESESSVLYEVRNYFYDREQSDIEILGPEIINVIYGLEFEIDSENPALYFETADDL